jgi:hypothetical protein
VLRAAEAEEGGGGGGAECFVLYYPTLPYLTVHAGCTKQSSFID